MSSIFEDVADLLAPMTRKRLWAVLTTARVPSAEMEPHAVAHLSYMGALEATGVLWGSGPFTAPGCVLGDGLSIFNVPEEADVHRLMAEEPLTKLGLRTYFVHQWELREGKITLDLLLSRSKVALG